MTEGVVYFMSDSMLHNDLLADLYQSAISVPPESFQDSVFKQMDRVIGFDRAWWGIMSHNRDSFDLYSSYRHELPLEFEEHWQEVRNDDALAVDAHSQPRTTIRFDEKALHSTPGLASLNTEHDLRHALCTSVFLPDRQSFLFISLFRSGSDARPFNSDEVYLKQLLTPHLYSCWRTNLYADIERSRHANKSKDVASAFIDRNGRIIYADSAFGDLIAERWPTWNGRDIPIQLLETRSTSKNSSGKKSIGLFVSQQYAGGLLRLDIRKSSLIDKLANREREIARYFALGHSYKEIALLTKLSPATVRHYLRVIYEKLEINDKAELVRMMGRHDFDTDFTLSSIRPRPNRDIDFLSNGFQS